jgi:HD-GYP domain-containing protein (c-di-GMP phosphodiesterase class II)
VHLKTRTEIGELATTFNSMSEELEQFVEDLKRAADENKALFMGSIQMLAGAVDEKDPYTRGHSDRVTKYSLMIAKEMGWTRDFWRSCASRRNCTMSAKSASKTAS